MVKKRSATDSREERSTIKIPPPLSDVERMQAVLEAKGFNPDQFKIRAVQKKPDGHGGGNLEIEMSLDVSQDEAERLIRMMTVKVFDPDKDTVSIGNSEVKLSSVKELPDTQLRVKPWTDKERGKRSKPKSDVPDLS
jgi:hypothetical protein